MEEDHIYDLHQIGPCENEKFKTEITEKDKFDAAKQILIGLGFLWLVAIVVSMVKPGAKFLDLCTITLSNLATLILTHYFRDNN